MGAWLWTVIACAVWGTAWARVGGLPVNPGRRLGSRSPEEIMAELDSLVGLTEVKAQMREITAQVEFTRQRVKMGLPAIGGQSLHMSFLGNPGTGKTVVARIVGELMVAMGAIESDKKGGNLVTEVSRADLVGQHVGETAMKVGEVFEKAKGGVLFIDEAYALVQPDSKDSFGHEAVDTLIKLMEDHRDEVVVILAGYQTEMVDFIAANPGFKSRVAFEFYFRDYTCSELVEIGEIQLKSKNVGLVDGKSEGVCASGLAKETCSWLAAAIRFHTGCCDNEDCGKEENRANGNGRTVRNILESSYREMASRVLSTFPPPLLIAYDKEVQPSTSGTGTQTTLKPPLDCGGAYQKVRGGGPYAYLNETGGADLRCAFRLLEGGDLRRATALALTEQLSANCQRTKTPVTVNLTEVFASAHAVDLNWDLLHTRIFGEHACAKAQVALRPEVARFLLEDDPEWGWGEPETGCDLQAQCKMCVAVMEDDDLRRNRANLELDTYADFCTKFLREPPGCREYCYSIVDHTLALLDSSEKFDCSAVVGETCPESAYPGGSKPWEKDHNDFAGATTDEEGRPLLRPGSQVEALMKELNELVGLESVKAGLSVLRDAVEFDMWRKRFHGASWSLLGQSFHMRFLGNPGTGKTVVARIVGKILVALGVIKGQGNSSEFVFKEVSRSDLIAKYTGQTAPKVIEAVKSAFGGVLFIDEAYSLITDKDDPFGKEAVDTLIKEIEDNRDKVVVIFAGYQKEMDAFFETNPGFQSRVPFRFEFADYSCQDLVAISDYSAQKNEIKPTPEALTWLQKVISTRTGCCTEAQLANGTCAGATRDNGNGRAVRNVLESAMRAMSVRVVAEGKVNRKAATQLTDADVAAVAAEELAVAVRATCKASHSAVPDLRKLATGARVLALPSFEETLAMAGSNCSQVTDLLNSTQPTAASASDAADIEITEPKLRAIFAELDAMVGLDSVKRAMREFYATVEFSKLRKSVGLAPLKAQSFHMRFLGNPGTGKTVVARIVGKLLMALGAISRPESEKKNVDDLPRTLPEVIFNEVSRADLVAEYVGHTAPKVQRQVQKSMGGVFFLDEAYSLVHEDKDPFGHEAVDTLIKEMEDKRANFVVICAGYEEEVETFFDSNPGFKSRVPFSFFFEDYTCAQLAEIGKLWLKSKDLKLPEEQGSFEDAIAFGTGCCEKLEDCPQDKARGNGRAARNLLEAAVRQMSSRLQGTVQPKEAYSQLTAEDFTAVLEKSLETTFAVPCGPRGPLAKIMQYSEWNFEDPAQFELFLRKEIGDLEQMKVRLRQLASKVTRAAATKGLSPSSQKQVKICRDKQEAAQESIVKRLEFYCSAGGLMDEVAKILETGEQKTAVEEAAVTLKAAQKDTEALAALLSALSDGVHASPRAEKATQSCTSNLAHLRQKHFRIPFDPFES